MTTEIAYELASRWKRLGGSIIDTILSMAVSVPIMNMLGVFERIRAGEQLGVREVFFLFVLGLVVFLSINGYFLSRDGQTVGKKIVGTRIVSVADGKILTLQRVFIYRYLPLSVVSQIPFLGWLCGLVDVLFIFRKDKRCIHDLIAGTKVVNV